MGLLDMITGATSAIGGAITAPIKDVMIKREERKQAHQTLQTQARMASEQNATTVEVERAHLEAVLAQQLAGSWKDEFITLSIVGIIPATVVGGVLQGFGFPGFLTGVLAGVTALVNLGLPIAYLMGAVALAGVGITIKNRLM